MRRSSSTIPFGYKLDEKNDALLEPILKEIEALDMVVDLIKSQALSLREGAIWLEYQTGRKLSHSGLKKIASKDAR